MKGVEKKVRAEMAGKVEDLQDSILRIPEVEEKCGIKRATIYKWMKAGSFPRSVRLGSRNTGWKASAVAAWVKDRDDSERSAA